MRINALLSGFSPVAVRGGENSFPPVAEVQGTSGQSTLPADVFEQGQAWKNLATASGPGVVGSGSGAGKTHPASAVQAYAKQAGGKEENPIPGAVAVGKEEKSGEASDVSQQGAAAVSKEQQEGGQEAVEPVKEKSLGAGGAKGIAGKTLTRAERLQVAKLEAIDTKVRAHEMAHLVAAGSYATGGASFQYAKGPDGKRYAVGGEVGIDTGKESTPEATISKMQTVRAAALAPADPSSQDRKVAAHATLVIAEAGQELQMARLEQARKEAESSATAQTGGKAASREEDGLSREQPAAAGASGQQPSAKVQQATAVMAGLMRPAARISIAV